MMPFPTDPHSTVYHTFLQQIVLHLYLHIIVSDQKPTDPDPEGHTMSHTQTQLQQRGAGLLCVYNTDVT